MRLLPWYIGSMNDLEFIDAFTAGQLPTAGFDHRAHLRAAYLLLRDRPFLEACMAMRDGLQSLAGKLGKPDLYHETVTVAFMALVAERSSSMDGDWDAFIAAHPELCGRGLLESYYSTALLASGAARTTFTLPDRIGGRHD